MTWWANFNRRHNNLPNGLSLFRALLGVILPFLLFVSNRNVHLLAAFVFFVGSVTDYLDGWLARRHGLESNFGKILDPTSDKILILCPLAALSIMGFFSKWWLVPIFAREIIITFCRIGWLLQGKAAGAERLGKIKLVVQVGTIAVAFLGLVVRDFPSLAEYRVLVEKSTLAALLITNILTILSGITFVQTNRRLFYDPEFAKYVSACGVGLLPGMTGTWGSLLAMCLVPLLTWNAFVYWGTFVFLLAVGYWAVARLDLSKEKDPQFVVIDEVLGIFITIAGGSLSAFNMAVGFALFRLFDIVKPFPCRRLEKLPGFWGITFDDLGAGFYACLLLHFFKL